MNLNKSYDFFQPEMIGAKIHIIGCGSVGSTVAENLARCGVKNMTLYDFDTVESHNIVNQMYIERQIGMPKVEALKQLLCEINSDLNDTVETVGEGWQGKTLSGYIFLCVDNIDIRRDFVEKHFDSPYVKAVFDFRTALTDAQHYAADWKDRKMKQDLLNSMQFSHEEAVAETPVSACGTTLGVATTVRVICALGVNNFINYVKGEGLKKLVVPEVFKFLLDAF